MYIKTSDQEEMNLGFMDYSCNWGVHICGLYETADERDDIIFGFLSEGIRAGDLELYCPAERSGSEFKTEFSARCPDCADRLEEPDTIQLDSPKSLYYPDGTFSPIAMDKGLNSFYEGSQKTGPRNIRATAEMVWALEAIPGVEYLMVYESRLNYFIPGKSWISICLYNITKFGGTIIMNALRTHPFTICKGTLIENPYYQDPDMWLRENAPGFLPENLEL